MATFNLTWDAASVGGALSVDDHDVEYTPSGGSATVVSTSSASNSHTISGLADGTEYSFRVRAKDGSVAGPWSAAVSAGGGSGDSSWDDVLLLVPFDSDTTDVKSAIAPTVSGSAIAITGSGKFGSYGANTASNTSSYATGAFGGGDWTVEFWLNRESFFDNNAKILDLGAVELEASAGVDINFYHVTSDTNFGTTANSFTQGQWFHIAIVYDSGVLRSYVDGVQLGSLTTSVTDPTSVVLGNTASFDDLRVTASARYPGGTTFTPPTAAHPTSGSAGGGAASTTELVFNFNNSLADSGPNSYVLNSAGGTGFDSTNKAFGSHSRTYQPYTSDSISNQGAAVTAMFSGDFTVECFHRLNPGSLGNTIWASGVWGTVDNTGLTFDGMTVFGDNYSNNYIGLYWYNGASSSGTIYSTTPMVDDGAFRHIAVVREGTTWRVYYDGTRIIENTAATNADPWTSQDQTLSIGIDPYMMGYDGTDGNIDDFRVSTSALYSGATITVPTAELS
ncbi:MAG: hypothetical protein EB075_08525 [Bacteroidetes bacterium]|nr:hypothetical protein [Bacteroidota bacterium]